MEAKFVADVGGTNIRIGRCDGLGVVDIQCYRCEQFALIQDVFFRYFSQYSGYQFVEGCIAIASYIGGAEVKMLNQPWHFSIRALQQELKLTCLQVINDFSAVALSLPLLNEQHVIQIGQGNAVNNASKVVCGPGTGLGMAQLVNINGQWTALDGEGGHIDYAPTNEDGVHVFRYLKSKYGRASYEDVLSGRGLVNIYNAIGVQRGQTTVYSKPEQITKNGLSKSCDLCHYTLLMFCQILGEFASNIALMAGAFGGVYISGGVIQHFKDMFLTSQFRQFFEQKGALTGYLTTIPTYLIVAPDHALIGASAYLDKTSIGA